MFEGVLCPSLTLIFGGWYDARICCANKKLPNLLKGFDLLNIHDDVHPAIMNEASPIVEY